MVEFLRKILVCLRIHDAARSALLEANSFGCTICLAALDSILCSEQKNI